MVKRKGGHYVPLFFSQTGCPDSIYVSVIQLTQANSAQGLFLKLDGYSSTSTTQEVTVTFTNQLTEEVTAFERLNPVSTNGRYQRINVTPPVDGDGNPTMVEGMYIVTVTTVDGLTEFATRLAFVAAIPAFSESTYTAYTVGDTDPYNVYTQ